MKGPWSTPFDRTVQPGLRPHMVQHSDGHTTILRPRRFHGVTPPAFSEEDGPLDAVEGCVPTSVADIVADPTTTPYNIDDIVTFSVTFDSAPTPPITYEWYKDVDGVQTLIGTDATLVYTVADADITAKNVDGLGRVVIKIDTFNCGSEVASTRTENFAAQGTPP